MGEIPLSSQLPWGAHAAPRAVSAPLLLAARGAPGTPAPIRARSAHPQPPQSRGPGVVPFCCSFLPSWGCIQTVGRGMALLCICTRDEALLAGAPWRSRRAVLRAALCGCCWPSGGGTACGAGAPRGGHCCDAGTHGYPLAVPEGQRCRDVVLRDESGPLAAQCWARHRPAVQHLRSKSATVFQVFCFFLTYFCIFIFHF